MNQMRNFFGGGQGGGQQFNMPGPLGGFMNMMQRFNQFRQNPLSALNSLGINVPPNVSGNPEAIVNYLRNSGQMSEDQFNQFSQMAQQFQNTMPRGF